MRRLLAAVLLLAFARPALAQGTMHLSWSECLPKGGTRNLDFSCGTLDGSETFLVTFSPAVPASQIFALEARVDIYPVPPPVGPGPAFPSWWQFESGGCRAGSLQPLSFDYTVPPYSVGSGCADPWQLRGSGVMDYARPSILTNGDPNVAVLRGIGTVPSSQSFAVALGTEYYAFRFTIDNAKTVGSATCDGCCTPMALIPVYLKIYQPVGVGDFELDGTPADRATWQGGGLACGPTPAVRRTWGMLKSLYR